MKCSTIDGRAEGEYHQVSEVPTTLILDFDEIETDRAATEKRGYLVKKFGEEIGVKRAWRGKIPESDELKSALENLLGIKIQSHV